MSERSYERRPRASLHEKTFRAFIAIDVQEEARKELSRLAAQLKGECKGSYPTSDMYHMTVAFLGDITPAKADGMCRVLEEVSEKYKPFDLTLCRLGYFNQIESATVFCSTARDNMLLSLAQDVYRAAWDCRIPFDDKPFRAHITLGRRVDLNSIRLNSISVKPVSFTVKGLTLYKSTLRPCGPTYEAIETIAF